MERIDYAQAVSRIRVLETRLLDKAKLDRMIDSTSPDDAMKVLLESEYSNSSGSVKRSEDYEILLSEEMKRIYSLMYKVSPEPRIIDIMSLKYDYHNMKVLLKGRALGKDLSYLLVPVGTVETEHLKKYLSEGNYTDLKPIMREALERAEKSFKENKDPQMIDIILDSSFYKDMLKRAEVLKEEYITGLIRKNADLNNIKTLFRVKKQNKGRKFLNEVIIDGGFIDKEVYMNSLNDTTENFVKKFLYTDYADILKLGAEEFERTGKLNMLEKLSDNFIMEYIKKAKYVSFGPEPVIAYIYAKESEIKAVRMIMVGKFNNISPEVIRERLRDIYV